MADPLQLVEHGIGQRQSLPGDLQPPVRKVVDLDLLALAPTTVRRIRRFMEPDSVPKRSVRTVVRARPASAPVDRLANTLRSAHRGVRNYWRDLRTWDS